VALLAISITVKKLKGKRKGGGSQNAWVGDDKGNNGHLEKGSVQGRIYILATKNIAHFEKPTKVRAEGKKQKKKKGPKSPGFQTEGATIQRFMSDTGNSHRKE